ncbi:MAG: Asp23/Gls24 family envelope stress response protein [Deltaproteobacteria bacterium]
MLSQDKNDLGQIKIHNNVIASIAFLAATEVEGVARVCDDLRSLALRTIGKKTLTGAIDVRPEANDNVNIIIPLIVKYGYNIPDIAGKVQERVRAAVEDSTDVTIQEVSIKIKGVEK